MISIENFLKQIASGVDSTRQFKADVRNTESSLASEMAAFARWLFDRRGVPRPEIF